MLRIMDGFKGERSLVLPKFIVEEFEKDPFSSNLYLTDIGFYPVAEFHYKSREQGAEQYILIFCRQGKGWFEHNGERHTVTENEFFILPANEKHAYGADKFNPWTIYWVHFQGRFASKFAHGFAHPTHIYSGYSNKITDITRTFEQIYNTLKQGYSTLNVRYVMSCLYSFLGTISYMSVYRGNQEDGQKTVVDVVERVINYMNENIEKRLDIKQLASLMRIAPSALSSTFKKKTGYTMLSYFNHLKIQEACNCLDHTDLTIKQISLKIGIEDSLYFSRLFTLIMGASPRNYRKEKKG